MVSKKLRTLLLFSLILIIIQMLGCTQFQPQSISPATSSEAKQIEAYKLNNAYSELKKHIETTNSVLNNLYNFQWNCLADIGMTGNEMPFRFNSRLSGVSLTDIYIPKKDMELLQGEAGKCLPLAGEIWFRNPYKEPQNAVEKSEYLTVAQWKELVRNISKQLGKLESLVNDYKSSIQSSSYPKIETVLKRADWSKDIYLPPFKIAEAEYVNLIDNLINEIKASQRSTSALLAWEFSALSGNIK